MIPGFRLEVANDIALTMEVVSKRPHKPGRQGALRVTALLPILCYTADPLRFNKRCLIVKEEYLNTEDSTFKGTGVRITLRKRHLGSALRARRAFTE